MRNYILFGIAALVLAASTTYATPVIDQQLVNDNQVVISDLVPIASISFDNMPRVNGNVNIDTNKAQTDNNLQSKWTPSWLSPSPQRWWHSLYGWNDWADQSQTHSVPEPATMLLFGSVLAGFAMITRRKMKK